MKKSCHNKIKSKITGAKVSRVLSEFLKCSAICVLFLFFTADSVAHIFLGIVLAAAIYALGTILPHYQEILGIICSLAVVAGAGLGSVICKVYKPFARCHRIKNKCGTYRNTYLTCRSAFDVLYDDRK